MKKTTLHTLHSLKDKGEAFTVLTAYDATFARLLDQCGVDAILVGDSLGMVIQGHNTTVPVAMEDCIYHVECVARATQSALIIADMPYMSYATPEQTFHNAAALMQAGANMVKVEGGEWLMESIEGLVQRGIPVCAHLGLTPQSVDALGGFKVQGRDEEGATKILNDALALEKAGASLLVLECVPAELAQQITTALSIPTIGIGAGSDCDAQVLVLQDMLGLNTQFTPKFVKNFMQQAGGSVQDAIDLYIKEVKERSFPAAEHTFE
ncbi:3-methyl-2-oxobutanoate hydroxymethyltransferase [Pleionea sp. CnH1-48]|uniref:3-methyl-2-oxobutanoate hydroxymethyltransferase n=1 Tax=Pleionea sp. CnH1-48 TaxID=2954494 RepID=UPI002097CAD5|nr:3-methyl-2-oxobutanoate hydroxymethyltransferase [Pleionea sp. CnH1-48]MCO7227357.1 3-methyl-2-oxobutanoate hydroxymethyltransferase [Pleionea sp. CnH1-48]